ncbi:MAG: AEC family transporter [Syntrophotaleaceae bacterium]
MALLNVLNIILPVFLVVGLGSLLRYLGLLDGGFFHQANRLVYFVCLPSLLFYKIGTADFHNTFNGPMVLGASAALVAGFAVSYLYAAWRPYPKGDIGTFSQGAFRANLAYIGLPIVFSAYGETALARAGMLMGCLVPLLNLLSILALLLPYFKGRCEGEQSLSLKRDLLYNPLVIGALLGLSWSFFDLPLPAPAASVLDLLARVALPLALIAIGGGFSLQKLRGDLRKALLASLFKTLAMPLATFLFLRLLQVRGLDFNLAILMAGAPTAAASYVTAHQMRGNAELAGSIIMLSTLISVASYTVLLLWLGNRLVG